MFVRALSDVLKFAGWEVALGGSVLKMGRSMNDLDVILFPTSSTNVDYDAAAKALQEWGMSRKHNKESVHAAWRKQGSKDEKHVEIWDYKSKRVDLFFLK
jgi:hypothetical protein